MIEDADYSEEVLISPRGKFKRECKSSWAKTKKKIEVNSINGKQPKISCNHDGNNWPCFAMELTKEDIQGID